MKIKMFFLKTALYLIIGISLIACQKSQQNATYRVSLRYIPAKIDVRNNQINTDVYIMAHLYWPLFSITDNGTISSHFLEMQSTQATSEKFDTFKLCLKKNIKFSNGQPIEAEDLKSSLVKIHKNQEFLNPIKDIIAKDNCVIIHLMDNDLGYFRKLTGFSTTILKDNDQSNFPIGKGPYKIESVSQDKISLVIDDVDTKNTFYSRIEFIRFKSAQENLKLKIDDWNHIYSAKIPLEIKSKYKIIQYPILKSNVVLINHPDKKVRALFVKCLDVEKLKKDLAVNYVNIPGFLPTGVFGYDVDFKEIKSTNLNHRSECSTISKDVITFYSYNKEYVGALDNYILRFNKKLPLKIVVKHTTIDETIAVAFSQKNYITLIGFDSSGSMNPIFEESSVFFESFTREKRLITEEIPGLKEMIDKAVKESDRNKKNKLYTKAHEILLKSNYIVPMGQTADVQYYPQNITNIKWVERISGIPQINLMVNDNGN